MKKIHQLATAAITLMFIISFSGCTRHEVEIKPVEIKPIHITIDVNVKIEKELDDFFGDIDKAMAEEANKSK